MLRCVKEDLELSLANIKVFICEGIGDVPADWAELSSVLDDCMEVRQRKQSLFVLFWFCTVI
jgi:hypothetical protein